MKKLLVVLALLTVSTLGYAKEVVTSDNGRIFIVDGTRVIVCDITACTIVTNDYTK